MKCFDERKLKEYLSGSLPAGEIVPANDHIRSCADCRAKIAELSSYRKAAVELASYATASQDCPEYETLSAYAGEELVGVELMAVERHVTNCELCAQDVETLQAVRSRASLAPSVTVTQGTFGKRSAWTVFGWRTTAAGALGAAAVAAILFMSSPGTVKKPGSSVVANNKPGVSAPANTVKTPTQVAVKPTAPETDKPAVAATDKPVVAHQTPKPERVALLQDGGVTIEKVGGEVRVTSGGSDLEKIVAASVEQKVRNGKLPADMKMAMLSPDTTRQPEKVIQIRKISPEPEKIASDRPMFEWQSVPDAERYRVEVTKIDGTTVLYEETTTNRLLARKPLQGGFYRWTVWTRMGEYAEWSISQSEWFRVLTKSEGELLASAEARYGKSHLVMGTVYEKLGMKDEAVKEFQALVSENPKSKLAARMLAGAK